MEKILEDVLEKSYNDTLQKILKIKKELPAAYKGFIDIHIKSLDAAKSQLKKDINFYSLKSGTKESITKSFELHCADRFLYVLTVCQPENILSYGMTYEEFLQEQKQH